MNQSAATTELRATFLTVMPSPYIQDLFEELSRRVRLTVLYLETEAPDTHWGDVPTPDYAEVLPGSWWGARGVRLHWNPGVCRRLEEIPADIRVVAGYMGFTQQAAMRWLNRRGLPWVFWGEVPGMRQRGRMGRWLRRKAMQPLAGARAIAAIGTRAAAAYAEAAPAATIENLPYYCNLAPFRQAASSSPWDGTRRLRVLYCGQLIARKGVDVLMRAIELLGPEADQAEWTFVGEGPMRAELEQRGRAAAQRIHLAGFLPPAELPAVFGQADVFVLPSRHDGWGVVVNQALGAGLPVVATRAVGAAVDWIQDDVNGWLVEPDCPEALSAALRRYLAAPERLARHRRAATETAGELELPRGAERWERLLWRTCRSDAPRNSLEQTA